ncbi:MULTISPECIES: hypothetical protein [unclassified Bradyrhizobium]|uniref:hypothetical protein n=1 Tax=unclassified Bradyrhizobium TaxID=2631580 RepID=UPI00247A53D2|nr:MULTISPECIES: hypothetical protein [unclassified Bradyrhizobium]WGR74932.1 hypothetical protein MTX24_19780 [Bradyrhizobium sp. ISRA426]WGR79768.1 hypothetical protein MTX21_04895 [Bradyrhizobium sp. ISRA430]WGR90104.1 hypothetical protein MTX25_19460 [Bradyrhizobium sp. ISRA432]
MRFILVNGRTPFRKTFCLWCCEEISGGYLRDVRTSLPYCDHACYARHHEAVSSIGERARAAS